MTRKIALLTSVFFLTIVAVPQFRNVVVAQDANLVRVNVFVTESSRDRRVTGLPKDAFEIFEDGVVQEIVSVTPGTEAGDYTLTFRPTNTVKDGTWRKLRVKVVPPKGLDETKVAFSVRFQSGYYAPAPGN